jgi:hypothetical protein
MGCIGNAAGQPRAKREQNINRGRIGWEKSVPHYTFRHFLVRDAEFNSPLSSS